MSTHLGVPPLTRGYSRKPDIQLRIALLGAPETAKSTVSAGLLYFSRLFEFKVDAVPDVKKWDLYKGINMTFPEYEMKKFREQKEYEELYPDDLEIVICEAPLIEHAVYASFYYGDESDVARELFNLAGQSAQRYTHYFLIKKPSKPKTFENEDADLHHEKIYAKTTEVLESLHLNFTTINQFDSHVPLQILQLVGAITKAPHAEQDRGTEKGPPRSGLERLRAQGLTLFDSVH